MLIGAKNAHQQAAHHLDSSTLSIDSQKKSIARIGNKISALVWI